MNEIVIGEQIWSADNLSTKVFNNGDPILEAKSNEEWSKASKEMKPAFCILNDQIYLYNYYAISDERGIIPDGWGMPNNADWNCLIDFAGGATEACNNLKSTEGWDSTNGNNSLGFNCKPTGYRSDDGYFFADDNSLFWSRSYDGGYQFANLMNESQMWMIGLNGYPLGYGLAIRLIKDDY
jgi:uncharacterized protein (TIGR02145 family)